MVDKKSPLDVPQELQHLIEKRSGEERRQEERREEADHSEDSVVSDEHGDPERRTGEEPRETSRRQEDR